MVAQTNALDIALAFIFQWEGGFVDDPKDPGGATKFGISLRFLRGLAPELGDVDGDGDIDADDIFGLTEEQAEELYFSRFWLMMRLGSLPPLVAIFVMDTAVNMGKRRSGLILQNALVSIGADIVVDGLIGPATNRAATEADSGLLIRELLLARTWHYAELTNKIPRFRRYLPGWLNRVAALDNLLTDTTPIIYNAA